MSFQRYFSLRSLQYAAAGLTAATLFSGSSANANLSISPQVIELDARRGQAQGTITVSNHESEPFRSRSYAAPFTYDREKGFQELTSSPSDLTPYLQFSPSELVVPGSDRRRVRFIARLAPNLPDGEYRAMLFTETLTLPPPQQFATANQTVVTSTIVPRIGVAVYVRKGNIHPNLSIDSIRFITAQQQPQLLVKNTGKASAIVSGEWTLKQGDREISKGMMQDTTVIAQSDRYVKVTLPNSETKKLSPGQYQLRGNLLWGFNHTEKIPFNLQFTVAP
jgi:hypothetical protein